MITSGSANFNLDIVESIEEAYERAGVEIRTGYQFKSARRSINLLFQEWANRGINLWTVEQGSILLNVGQVEYDLPPDTVDLLEHVIRQNDGNASLQTDLQITRIALPTYATLPNKLTTGRPIQIYIDRQARWPKIKIWPAANQTGYTLVYWRLRRIQDAGDVGSYNLDLPFRFLPAFVAGLAYYVALKTPGAEQRIGLLKQNYDEAFNLAASEDRDKAPVRIVPNIGYI